MTITVYVKLQPQIAAYLHALFAPDSPQGSPLVIRKGTKVPWRLLHPTLSERECEIFGNLDKVFLKALTPCIDNEESWKLYDMAFSESSYHYAQFSRYTKGKHVPQRKDLAKLTPISVNVPDHLYPKREINTLTFANDKGQGARFVDACKLLLKQSMRDYLTRMRQSAERTNTKFDVTEAVQKYCEDHKFPANITENIRNYSYRWKLWDFINGGMDVNNS